jgi:hypothetical protein
MLFCLENPATVPQKNFVLGQLRIRMAVFLRESMVWSLNLAYKFTSRHTRFKASLKQISG